MRTKNSLAITESEREHLALVKGCACAFCDAPPPVEAHHPRGCQGLHRCAISACETCHAAHVWNYCGMTEMQALNLTLQRVDDLRKGKTTIAARPTKSRQNSTRTPDGGKIFRGFAA